MVPKWNRGLVESLLYFPCKLIYLQINLNPIKVSSNPKHSGPFEIFLNSKQLICIYIPSNVLFLRFFTELTPNLTVPIPPERSNLVLRLSTLAESILTWSFISINLPKKLISVFEADQNPSLRPGASWKEVILNQEIPKLFFEVSKSFTNRHSYFSSFLKCLIFS